MAEGGALRELLAHFEVEVDDEKLDAFGERLEHFKKGLERVGERMAEVFAIHELKEFVMGTVEMGAQLVDTSRRLGLTTEELQKFQFAARLGGVEAESAAHSLGLFMRKLGETGGAGASQELGKIGVKVKDAGGQMRPTLDILEDVADHMKATEDPTKNAALAMKLFGRAGLAMVPVLKEGGEGLREIYKEFDELGGGMGEDFVKEAKKADDEMAKLKLGWVSLKSKIVAQVLPFMLQVVETLKSWTKGVKELVDHTHMLQHLFDFAKIMVAVKVLKEMAIVMRAIAAGEGLIDILDPFTLMLIGAVALYAVLDDLWTMMEGGESVIGDALGPDKQAMIDQLRGSMDELRQTWADMQPDVKELGKELFTIGIEALPLMVKGLALVLKLINSIVTVSKGLGNMLGDQFNGNFERAAADVKDIGAGLTGQHGGYAKEFDAGQDAGDRGKTLLEDIAFKSTMATQRNQMQILYPNDRSVGGPGPGGTGIREPSTVNSHNTTNIKVEVKHSGTETSDELGKRVGAGVQKELDAAMLNGLNAVRTK